MINKWINHIVNLLWIQQLVYLENKQIKIHKYKFIKMNKALKIIYNNIKMIGFIMNINLLNIKMKMKKIFMKKWHKMLKNSQIKILVMYMIIIHMKII